MAQLIVNMHELVKTYINTADDRYLAQEIGDELLQLTRAVIKKLTLPGEKAFKYHLSQPSRMLSRTMVHWHKIILRRMKCFSSVDSVVYLECFSRSIRVL